MFLFTSVFTTGAGVAEPPPEPVYETVSDTPNIGGMWTGSAPGSTHAQRYLTGHAGKIVGAGLHIRSGPSDLRLAIYADTDELPGALLGQVSGATAGNDAWADLDLDPADYVDVAADTHVWVAVQVESSSLTIWRPQWPETALDIQFNNTVGYVGGFPDPFGDSDWSGGYPMRFKIWTNP